MCCLFLCIPAIIVCFFNFNENYKSSTLKVGTSFYQAFIASLHPIALHTCANIFCSMIVRDFDAMNMMIYDDGGSCNPVRLSLK